MGGGAAEWTRISLCWPTAAHTHTYYEQCILVSTSPGMPEWIGSCGMSNVSHTQAKWELSVQHFSSAQLPFPDDGSYMLPKCWKDCSHLASVCATFDKHESCDCRSAVTPSLSVG